MAKKPRPMTKEEEFEQACIRGLFILFIFFIPVICQAETVDWSCNKTKLVSHHEFKICSDLVEAEADAKRLSGKVAAIKDVDGHLAYGVFYDVIIASGSLCGQMQD